MTILSADIQNPLPAIKALIAEDLRAVDQLIVSSLISPIPLIQTITQHIVNSGGKRLRPLIVLLAAKACGYQKGTEHHELAAVIEFIHTATLLHDDVIDTSQLRRGQQTANAIWGNEASVLVGDFLYSRAFQVLARRSNVPVMKVLANTTNQLAEGEVWQLMNRHDPETEEFAYREVIRRKTAQLFSAATEIAAIAATEDTVIREAMTQFGLAFGMAYQIIDDLLDYTASAEQMGKNVGDDLMEGKATLPLIYAKKHANPKDAQLIHDAIEKGGLDHLPEILKIIKTTGALEYTHQCAQQHATKAQQFLKHLPDSPYRDALNTLTHFITERNY